MNVRAPFNINDEVRVKLTDRGRAVLRYKGTPLPKEDEQGYSTWQLWALMTYFGEYIYLGCDPVFETEIMFEFEIKHVLLGSPSA